MRSAFLGSAARSASAKTFLHADHLAIRPSHSGSVVKMRISLLSMRYCSALLFLLQLILLLLFLHLAFAKAVHHGYLGDGLVDGLSLLFGEGSCGTRILREGVHPPHLHSRQLLVDANLALAALVLLTFLLGVGLGLMPGVNHSIGRNVRFALGGHSVDSISLLPGLGTIVVKGFVLVVILTIVFLLATGQALPKDDADANDHERDQGSADGNDEQVHVHPLGSAGNRPTTLFWMDGSALHLTIDIAGGYIVLDVQRCDNDWCVRRHTSGRNGRCARWAHTSGRHG